MVTSIAALRAAGMLSALDEHFARAVGRIASEQRPEVLLAAALTSRYVAQGHVCLDISRLSAAGAVYDDAGQVVAEDAWPPAAQWLEMLRASPLVGDAGSATVAPFVLDGAGRLYLRRYWEHETGLARGLLARATQVEPGLNGAWVRTALARLFPAAGASDESDWQRIAAVLALARRFCVISGGPGTGKTFTVVKLLALLVEEALHAGRRIPGMTLLAPTGKAATRLSEAIRKAKATLACGDAVKNAIPEDAATIHRCLSPIGGSATRFRYHAGNPLVTDVVLVDEASMVDLALMSRLLAAVPPHARFILLGDKDQLASVEAGAVLGDICNTGAPRSYSRGLNDDLERLTGEHLPLDAAAPAGTGIWDCIVQLTHSYRYRADSGIGALAHAINAGDAECALALLDAGAASGIARLDPGPHALHPTLRAGIVTGFAPYLHARAAAERLRHLERFRVLCAHRRGPDGVEAINRQIESMLAEAGLITPASTAYVGRPVMVTRNDYELDLFNGDVGVIADDAADDLSGDGEEKGAGAARRAVFFLGEGGQLRRLAPSRLPPHETVYAMSIHKSQGSEFDQVAVLLPSRPSPVLSRELLYTAVTRARLQVTIHATREVTAAAITRRLERVSGLRELLWNARPVGRTSP